MNSVFADQRRALCLQMLTLLASSPAWSQGKSGASKAWPVKPVNLIVPFPAGGASALLGKHLSAAFERETKQSMRLDYRGGSGGMHGASYAASAPADGYHMLVGGSHLAKMRALMPNTEFDFIEDLEPLALMANMPQVVLVNPARLKARTIAEWMSELRRKPSRYRMASAGLGSSAHIAAEILRTQQSLNFEFVHFRGSGPALQDLLAGSVDTMVDSLVSCLPYLRSGSLRPLMVTGTQRLAVLPEVPCAAELGIDSLDRLAWYGLFAPQDISVVLKKTLIDLLKTLGEDSLLLADYAAMGVEWGGIYGEEFEAMVRAQTQEWAQRLKTLGIKSIQVKESEEV